MIVVVAELGKRRKCLQPAACRISIILFLERNLEPRAAQAQAIYIYIYIYKPGASRVWISKLQHTMDVVEQR